MSETETPIQAIPTTYNGVQLRSRMEAQCALLLDTINAEWEYEPCSVMLPNGISYTPDFWLPRFRTAVECRGYDSEKGRGQITGFRELVRSGILPEKLSGCCALLTIGPSEVEYYCYPVLTTANLSWCHYCETWCPSGTLVNVCVRCGRECAYTGKLDIDKGKILVAGFASDKWGSLRQFIDIHGNNQNALVELSKNIERLSQAITELASDRRSLL